MHRRVAATCTVALSTLLTVTAAAAPPEAEQYWPSWRGPLHNGVAPHAKPPTTWSETQNIRWKVELPGLGHASPVVWGDRIYVLTAVKTDRTSAAAEPPRASPRLGALDEPRSPDADASLAPQNAQEQPPGERPRRGQDRPRRRPGGFGGGNTPTNVYEFVVLAIDRQSGQTVWRKKVHEQIPHAGTHPTATFASASPVTNGEHIYAFFGSYGLYCLDRDGDVVWKADLGDMQTRNSFGEGASPALHGDTLVVTWDHEEDDFIVAFDAKTGKQRWRTPRDEPTTWSTPLVVEVAGKHQVIASGTNNVCSYDLQTGELVWKCGGLTMNVIPTPVVHDGVLYATSGFRGNMLRAIKLADASGDLSGKPNLLWTYEKDTPYVPSPLLYDGCLYFIDNNRPVLTCLSAADGEPVYSRQRLEALQVIYASPVAAAGHVYVADRDGKTVVLKHRSPEVVATNVLDDSIDASPAIAGDEIYLRGHKYLYCIAAN